jgi:hypothetical protein
MELLAHNAELYILHKCGSVLTKHAVNESTTIYDRQESWNSSGNVPAILTQHFPHITQEECWDNTLKQATTASFKIIYWLTIHDLHTSFHVI